MSNAIEIRDLSYRAGRSFALRDVSVTVPQGSIYGFLGPNGAGKTTTVRLLLGMVRRDAGDVRLLGHAVPGDLPSALALTGYVPERPHVYASLRVDEAIRCHAAFHAQRWDAGWATRLQRLFELPGDRRVGRLSKGETGKLLMLLALAQRPELLILDEPTDGLDPMVRRDVLAALRLRTRTARRRSDAPAIRSAGVLPRSCSRVDGTQTYPMNRLSGFDAAG
jgi:ABC-2 type transport system ATP-binding protein